MIALRSLLLLAALSAVSAPASMIHYDDRASTETMMQPLEATLSSGAVPAWWWRLTPVTASRREE